MFDNILNLFKKKSNKDENKNTAKERLHLVLMQDRANVSADFLDLMKQEIIEVIKKYIDVDEEQIDVKLTNKLNGDGTTGAPALYANIPIKNIKKETRINSNKDRDELLQNKEEDTDATNNVVENNNESENTTINNEQNNADENQNLNNEKQINDDSSNEQNTIVEDNQEQVNDENKANSEDSSNVQEDNSNNDEIEKKELTNEQNDSIVKSQEKGNNKKKKK